MNIMGLTEVGQAKFDALAKAAAVFGFEPSKADSVLGFELTPDGVSISVAFRNRACVAPMRLALASEDYDQRIFEPRSSSWRLT